MIQTWLGYFVLTHSQLAEGKKNILAGAFNFDIFEMVLFDFLV